MSLLSDKIQFTTTATLRPTVLEDTLSSFSANITDMSMKDCECLINIDCVPLGLTEPSALIEICNKYFGTVTPNISHSPNFCASVKWLWTHATTDYLFHLEDDWALLKPIKMGDILPLFDNPDLYEVRLRKRTKEYGMHWYGLSPCIVARQCYSLASKLNINENPEIQLKEICGPPEGRVGVYPHFELGLYEKPPPEIVLVRDIGRDWRKVHGMSKPRKEEERQFVSWTKRKKILR